MPSGHGLIDTGAILALLDRKDRWHAACADALEQVRFPLLTTAAVLTELFHLIDQRELSPAWDFLKTGAVHVVDIGDSDLPRLESLMLKYGDRPMDFADATLVHVAEREKQSLVFTVDHDAFETYRIGGRKSFRIVPTRRDP